MLDGHPVPERKSRARKASRARFGSQVLACFESLRARPSAIPLRSSGAPSGFFNKLFRRIPGVCDLAVTRAIRLRSEACAGPRSTRLVSPNRRALTLNPAGRRSLACARRCALARTRAAGEETPGELFSRRAAPLNGKSKSRNIRTEEQRTWRAKPTFKNEFKN